MNEAETRAEHIDPALNAAGWGVIKDSKILREYKITKGRLEGHGRRARALIADYVLVYRNTKLAIIEAKAWDKPLTEGVAQAKNYAGLLSIRFTYATNGQGIYSIDMQTAKEAEVAQYPTPDELWARTFATPNPWRDRFAAIPFEDKGGSHPGRYYQDIAVERVMEAISNKQQRILLTLATGTGKTFIAFQIAWKLFKSDWNLSRNSRRTELVEVTRQPRILFLADRNILANQAYNAFSAFPEDALVRIEPTDIKKKGKVPKNGSLFFTIFQTFMSGGSTSDTLSLSKGSPTASNKAPELVEGAALSLSKGDTQSLLKGDTLSLSKGYFGEYPPDFFDLIVIDECHRGGANDEGNWRAILDYFAPAVQLGLTATPKREGNVDTYEYFGEPVYIYSLKDGINDGFLTPFRLEQITSTMDEYKFTPGDGVVAQGVVDPNKLYQEADFNRSIVIPARERQRVKLMMDRIKQSEKTLVFCATQEHALMVRDLINQNKTSTDPNYCQRVTSNDGALGEQHLRDFQDNERSIPTILTTSQKLSTGVDARNVRNIVLLRPVNSMIEFKQIIGRGTRLFDGKDYFTIYDFVKAHHHFQDPEWDGEPVDHTDAGSQGPFTDEARAPRAEQEPRQKVVIKLSDGKARSIQSTISTTFWLNGAAVSSQQFMEALFGQLPAFFTNEAELRTLWSDPETRHKLLEGLSEKGFGASQLAEMQGLISAEKSDLFDVLAYVAYSVPTLTREARAEKAKLVLSTHFNSKQRVFLDFVLSHYVNVGVEELDQNKLTPLLKLKYHDSIADAVADLGKTDEIRRLFAGFQRFLYNSAQAA